VRVLTQTAPAADHRRRTAGSPASSAARCARAGWAGSAHRVLHRSTSVKPGLYVPALGRALHRPVAGWNAGTAARCGSSARRGVVLAAGGFVANREMVREHAPAYRGGLPLGTPATTARASGSASRPAARPAAGPGRPLAVPHPAQRAAAAACWSTRRAAGLRRVPVRRGDRRRRLRSPAAGLAARRRAVLAEARRQVRAQTLWFQRLQARYLLAPAGSPRRRSRRRRRGPASTPGAARHRRGVQRGPGRPTRPGQAGRVRPAAGPPAVLADRRLGAAPARLAGADAHPRRPGRRRGHRAGARAATGAMPGLYAAGRTAVGICSNSYVSGLSLADCVFSGRRAGRSAASAAVENLGGPVLTEADQPVAGRPAARRRARPRADPAAGRDLSRTSTWPTPTRSSCSTSGAAAARWSATRSACRRRRCSR
jgi:3-oxo-5alpha-steroid 4-dehydrogenase